MMTSAQVVETSVNVTSNSPSQDYTHPDDHNLPNYDMTPGFKPFTMSVCLLLAMPTWYRPLRAHPGSLLWFFFSHPILLPAAMNQHFTRSSPLRTTSSWVSHILSFPRRCLRMPSWKYTLLDLKMCVCKGCLKYSKHWNVLKTLAQPSISCDWDFVRATEKLS